MTAAVTRAVGVADWLGADDGVTADMTDAEIETLAREMEAIAEHDGIILDGDLERALLRVRDHLIDKRG